MVELVFDCLDVRPDRHAAAPTLLFRLQITELTRTPIQAMALRCQIRIEPQRRRYSREEAERLVDLFGEPSRWADTLKPMQFAYVDRMIPGFVGRTEVELPVGCTYDLEVAASRYFDALEEGEVPLLLLFSGTVFYGGEKGFRVEQIPWHKEASYRMPVSVWRELMDLYFPGSGWLRLRRDTIERLGRFKSGRALPTWDDALNALLDSVDG
jgi:hypothetical protein